jgi:hypothetical protein
MLYCDRTDAILKWSSEEVIIPYVSPLDGRVHRYFPDFYIKMIDRNGRVREKIIEVKPHAQCSKPKVPKRKTKSYVNAVKTWTINEAKWIAAEKFCEDRNYEFDILTEKHLYK